MERETNGTKTLTNRSTVCRRTRVSRLKYMTKITMLISLLIVYLYYSRSGLSFHQKQSTQSAALPTRFFPAHSHVLDFPYGQLQPVINLLQDEELLLVMYYAPWCAASVHVREEFIRAAKVLSNTVKSVAINCWYTEGECRKNLRFNSFPEIFVYHTGVLDGYRFTGIKQAEYFVKFVETFLYPVEPLHNEKQVKAFIAQNDNAVIGYFDFNSSPQPPGTAYHQFYLTSLRTMAYELYAPVRFGVVCVQRLARLLDLDVPDRLVLTRTGNSSLRYPEQYNMTSKNMTNWILYYKQKNVAQWLVPPGIKSLTLSLPMQKGPAVFLFGPVNPLLPFNPYFEMVRLAMYVYNSCGNATSAFENRIKFIVAKTLSELERTKYMYKRCSTKSQSSPQYAKKVPSNESKCCVSLASGADQEQESSVCEYCVKKYGSDRDTICDMGPDFNHGLSSVSLHSCADFLNVYNMNEHRSLHCRDPVSGFSERVPVDGDGRRKSRRNTDPFVINGANNELQRQCSKFTLRKVKNLLTLEELANSVTKLKDVFTSNFSGLACRTNKTVNFYFLDNVYHSVFLERLGVPLVRQTHKASVILTDIQNEADYVMQDNVTFNNIANFVVNYTQGHLRRHQRSNEATSPSLCNDSGPSVCITTVTADTFQTVVMDDSKDVVLLFYTDWCGFCSTFSQTFLKAAQYFNHSKSILFARVNGDTNDLPWEYHVDSYPTVILFPATRKSDSVLFPPEVPKISSNLIKFVLYHSNQSVQLDAATRRCSQSCVEKNIQRVIQRRGEIHSLMGQLQRRRQVLLSKLSTHVEHQHLIKKAIEATKQMYDLRLSKIRVANLLAYFLQDDFSKLDKAMLMQFIKQS